MNTRDTNGNTVVFNVFVNENKPIWNPSSWQIQTESFQNPASLTIVGDTIGTTIGWHTDRPERVYDGNPCLQWTYEYRIRVAGKSTELKVETLGWYG
jgi:hypothetical protein